MPDVYFWRQLRVILSIFLHSLCDGVSYSFPGIVNAVILNPNSTDIRATPAEASHIASIPGLGAFIGIFFLSYLLQNIGRRLTIICILSIDLISWAILPYADSVNTIIAARLLRGLGDGLLFNTIMISEYVDPKRRGYFATLKKLCVGVGAFVSHTMVLRYNFRQVAIFPVSCLLTAIVLTFYWPESPAYSAFRGRFEDCKRNFEYLHGNSEKKQEELRSLMGAQMVRIEKTKKKKESVIKTVLKTLVQKDFMKASFVTAILVLLMDLCGRHYYLAFINQVFLMISGDKSIAAYCSIFSDILTIISLILSSFVICCFKRRTLTFFFGFLSSALVFVISIAEFLKSKYSIGIQLPWLVPVVMLILNFVVNMGVVPLSIVLAVEVYPVESRGLGLCVASFNVNIFTYLLGLKLTPIMVNTLGLDVTFGIFGAGIIICMIILYYILPETKDRTMQEIEDEVKNEDISVIELRPILLKEKFEIQ